MSEERKMLIRAYGAELVETDNALGMKGAIAKAAELSREISGAVIAGQFTNPDGVRAHRETTGPEIWSDTDGEVDIFVAGIGTGGTISGIGQYLKGVMPEIKIVGVEPSDSPFLTKGVSGAHGIQGIGAGFKPEILDLTVVDKVVTMELDRAISAARLLARSEGVLVGISSGAALAAAIDEASREENRGKTVVVLLPDTGERYLSAGLFE
jgi:cysteine synthase A